ncbi:hypothetical protein, partial [Shewanella xiamenensis]|uniref:hypothetical protein n=1 Tax=Shewanella xiamenensis TaxID=332186 RepID=UPI0024A6F5A3
WEPFPHFLAVGMARRKCSCIRISYLVFNVIARGVKTIAAVCRFVYRIWLMADLSLNTVAEAL